MLLALALSASTAHAALLYHDGKARLSGHHDESRAFQAVFIVLGASTERLG